MKENYEVSEDWTGTKYVGLTLKWDYGRRKVHISMPGYIKKALERFNHQCPEVPQNAPYPHLRPNYGAKIQYAMEPDNEQFWETRTSDSSSRSPEHYCIMPALSTARS